MSLISFTPIQDGVTGVNAAATNNPLNTIYNDYNGNITDANIAANAGIAGSKVNFGSVANPYKFSAYSSAGSQSTTANTFTKITFNVEEYDTGSNFDSTTNYRFIAPVAGFYIFSGTITYDSTANAHVETAALYKNGTLFKQAGNNVGNGTQTQLSVNPPPLQLGAGDYIELWSGNTSGSPVMVLAGQALTYFGGYLLSAT